MINNLIRKFEFRILFALFLIKRRFLNSNNDWIMGRVACMGRDVLKLLEINSELINVQKGRIDHLDNIWKSNNNKLSLNKVLPFIKRDDIKFLIFQQKISYKFMKNKPLMLFMDSYSELTDQEFFNKKEKWSFFANYTDINHTKKFKSNFDSKGLIDVNILYQKYMSFFKKFRELYKDVPIVFLHFPVDLDNREKFKNRHSDIKDIINCIKIEFEDFYSFEVNKNIVDWPEDKNIDNFPYHYNKETYIDLANQINKSNLNYK
jgi:hypothetical protein